MLQIGFIFYQYMYMQMASLISTMFLLHYTSCVFNSHLDYMYLPPLTQSQGPSPSQPTSGTSYLFPFQHSPALTPTHQVYNTSPPTHIPTSHLPGSSLHGLSVQDLQGPSGSGVDLIVHHVLQSLVIGGTQEDLGIQLPPRETVVQNLYKLQYQNAFKSTFNAK